MNSALILCLCAFGAALVFALVVNNWRLRFAEAARGVPLVHVAETASPMVTFIVPARNAVGTIAGLLQDLHAQSYPRDRTEVLVVDDHSEDGTAPTVSSMARTWPQLRAIASDGIGKKAAISCGVHEAKGELVVMTDADARCSPGRLMSIARHVQRTGADMVLLPVRTESQGGLLGRLQEDEQAALLGVAVGSAASGSPVLAYGANLAFSKAAFLEIGGYAGDSYASGDDVFLLHRMKRAGKSISFLLDREAVVTVQGVASLRAFLEQRLRWAGKMRGVKGGSTWIGALALLFPWLLLAATIAIDAYRAANQGLFRCALLLLCAWILWIVPVIALTNDVRSYLGKQRSVTFSAVSFLLFSVYAPVITITSLFVRPEWKGRKV